jgi:protein involved in polysaccharide export with SLBB domain
MRNARPNPDRQERQGHGSKATLCHHQVTRWSFIGALLLGCVWSGGCAAVSNPVADGVPVNRLPPEVFGKRKNEERTIPLTLLRQKPPNVYRLGPGDVLGVYIEGVLGEPKTSPPVQYSDQGNLPPSIGYPIPVRDDGTLPLPYVEPLQVNGLTLAAAQDLIIKTYTETKPILKVGQERVIVTLVKPRQYHILVVRQDSGGLTLGGATGTGGGSGGATGVLGQTKRGTGYVVSLPAYENDVLNALAKTGGLPGLDAENEVIIQRGYFEDFNDRDGVLRHVERGPHCGPDGRAGGQMIHIPMRLRPDEPPPFGPEDVILQTGDIVFIEARDTEVFYTGGLMPARQVVLPRDYDLDVVEAIALVSGPLINGAQGFNNLSGNIVNPGVGFPNPSLVTVIRRTARWGQIPIRIDLNQALRDPRQRILIQAGDLIILQETLDETIARYFTEVFQLNLLGTIIRQNDLIGTTTLRVP